MLNRCRRGLPLLVSVAVLSGCSSAATSWDNAGGRVGDEVRVCGPVEGVGRDEDDTFINLGKDYPDPDRFTIVIWDQADFRAPATSDTLHACVSGIVSEYDGVPQIEVQDGAKVDFSDGEPEDERDFISPGDGYSWTVLVK
jgi:hypothetical protein